MAPPPDKAALAALERALADVLRVAGGEPSATVVKTIREGLARHADAVEAARSGSDPIRMPRASFDPSDPKTVGRMVSLALLAQPLLPIADVRPAYGSGVYAIYYRGAHPFYAGISGTETPIYVGKADPSQDDASTSREQGPKLTGRLTEHGKTIATAARASIEAALPPGRHPIKLDEFWCRRLVCSTNAQLVAEKHLIQMFWPLWNSETKACWGMSKHGDAAKTRANKRSPWDVVHPGRIWAADTSLKDSLTLEQIQARIEKTLRETPPRRDHAMLLEEMLTAFRQDDGPLTTDDAAPPVGATAAGPGDDEAGGPEDD